MKPENVNVENELTLKLAQIQTEFEAFMKDAEKNAVKGNKAAGTRARVVSMKIRTYLKEWKKLSTEVSE